MHRFKQLILALLDAAMLFAGLFIALLARYGSIPSWHLGDLISSMAALFFGALVINFIVGLYDLVRAKNNWIFYQKIIVSALCWVLLGIIYFYIRPDVTVKPKTILALTGLAGFGLIAIWRSLYNRFLSKKFWNARVVFAGLTPEVIELAELMAGEPALGYETAGIITRPGDALPPIFAAIPSGHTLQAVTAGRSVDLIVITEAMAADAALLKELYGELFRHASLVELAEFYELIFKRIPPFTFSESWFLIHLQEQRKKIYDRFRIIVDYFLAAGMLIFFIATLPLISLLIAASSRGPIFFRQKRVGRLGRSFQIYKYRTMRALAADGSAETNGPQFAKTNDKRVTAIGKFLRRTRLDEIPQCLNILKGEMAIVGPRPERPEFVAELVAGMPFYSLRHLIKPGLTGWAQLHKDYYGDIEENLRKLEFDLFYIKNRTLMLDFVIMLRTINVLLRMGGR